MKGIPTVLTRTAIAATLLAFASQAAALNSRSFVASYGSDADPCQLPTPCRSFTTALAATSAGGEIIALDSAGYGAVTVNKPVSIVAPPGVHAGIAVISGNGVDVAAGSGDVVLRGLTITGVPGSSVGISVSSAQTVNIDRCTVSGMGSHGLQYVSANALIVTDTVFRRNGGHGVSQFNGSAVYTRLRSEQNTGAGVSASGQVTEIHDSTLAQNAGGGVIGSQAVVLASSRVIGNGSDGVSVTPFGPLTIVGSVIDGNASRGVVVAGGQATLSRSTITRNGFEGVNASGGGMTIVFDGVTIGQNGGSAIIIGAGVNALTRVNNSIQGTVTGTLTSAPLI
jgi:hypothetical protein